MMKEIRCPHCNQLLMKAKFCDCEIKCLRCKKTIKIKLNNKDRVSNTTIVSE